jgi:hypothetical protein
MFPETNDEAKTTFMLVVPCPEINVTPAGTAHK